METLHKVIYQEFAVKPKQNAIYLMILTFCKDSREMLDKNLLSAVSGAVAVFSAVASAAAPFPELEQLFVGRHPSFSLMHI